MKFRSTVNGMNINGARQVMPLESSWLPVQGAKGATLRLADLTGISPSSRLSPTVLLTPVASHNASLTRAFTPELQSATAGGSLPRRG